NIVLATFTDANPSASASDFAPSVDWGGTLVGTPSVFIALVSQSPTQTVWEVVGNATYAAAGSYTPTVTVSDGGVASIQTGNTAIAVTAGSPPVAFSFTGEYAVATNGSNTLTLASINQFGSSQLT